MECYFGQLDFSIVVILILIRIMWNIAGWAENVTRKMGDGD